MEGSPSPRQESTTVQTVPRSLQKAKMSSWLPEQMLVLYSKCGPAEGVLDLELNLNCY